MSISAIIDNVFEDGNDLILDLMPKDVGGLAGQPHLIIKQYTYVPRPGQEIWGGSDLVIIEPGDTTLPQVKYRRISYMELVEVEETR